MVPIFGKIHEFHSPLLFQPTQGGGWENGENRSPKPGSHISQALRHGGFSLGGIPRSWRPNVSERSTESTKNDRNSLPKKPTWGFFVLELFPNCNRNPFPWTSDGPKSARMAIIFWRFPLTRNFQGGKTDANLNTRSNSQRAFSQFENVVNNSF